MIDHQLRWPMKVSELLSRSWSTNFCSTHRWWIGHIKNITLQNHPWLLKDDEDLYEMDTKTFDTSSTWQSNRLLWRTSVKLQPTCNCSIVTADKTWIHHYGPLTQQEAKTWKKSGEKTLTWPWVIPSTDKIIMVIFWNCKGVLLVDFLPRDTIINGPY